MRVRRFFATSVLALTFAGAVWANIKVDWDKTASFANYKTYAWTKGTQLANGLWDQRVVEGVDEQLGGKGFQKVDVANNPDLVVLYHGSVGTQTQLNTTNMGGWGWRWGGGISTTSVDNIPVGQLSVDIGDAKTKKLLWLGSASDRLSDNPDKNQKKLKSALENMFKKFPPPVKK